MKIKLHLIKPSLHPVRTSGDKEKMDELAQSIREQGLVVPVKVRPMGDEYELVYGQRRVEAARQAGLYEIEAIVEGMEDTDALVQALIENVVREDLGSMDVARGLKALQEATGWSQHEIERQGILARQYVGRLLALLDEPAEIQESIEEGGTDGTPTVTEFHVRQVRIADLSDPDKISVIRKVEREGLTAKQTRQVANAVKHVEHNRLAKIKLLETPIVRDPEIWQALAGFKKEQDEEKEAKVYDHLDNLNVKAFAEAIIYMRRIIEEQWQLVERDLVGAEHMPYLASRLRRFASRLNSMAEQLDEKRAEEIDEHSGKEV